jgi:hypothetical protein
VSDYVIQVIFVLRVKKFCLSIILFVHGKLDMTEGIELDMLILQIELYFMIGNKSLCSAKADCGGMGVLKLRESRRRYWKAERPLL